MASQKAFFKTVVVPFLEQLNFLCQGVRSYSAVEAHAEDSVASVRTDDPPAYTYLVVDSQKHPASNESGSLFIRGYPRETYQPILQPGPKSPPLVAD